MTSGNLINDPLARAVLSKLAEIHSKDEPLGSFARTVLSGEANLQAGAQHPWHGQALGDAFTNALEAQRHLSDKERAEVEGSAARLREPSETRSEAGDDWTGQP